MSDSSRTAAAPGRFSRRTLLVATLTGAAVTVVGCTGDPTDDADRATPAQADQLAAQVAVQTALVAAYDRAFAAAPELATTAAGLADQARQQLDSLRAAAPGSTPTATASFPAPAPADAATASAQLRTEVTRAADAHAGACPGFRGGRAALLGSIAAGLRGQDAPLAGPAPASDPAPAGGSEAPTPTDAAPTTEPRGPGAAAEDAALQDALAAAHAAVWGYGVVGAALPVEDRAPVDAARAAHRDVRDELAALLSGRGVDPVGTEGAYALPFPVLSAVDAAALAVTLEEGASAAWTWVLDQADEAGTRVRAVSALTDAERRAVTWRAAAERTPVTSAFPGLPVG